MIITFFTISSFSFFTRSNREKLSDDGNMQRRNKFCQKVCSFLHVNVTYGKSSANSRQLESDALALNMQKFLKWERLKLWFETKLLKNAQIYFLQFHIEVLNAGENVWV